jgi:N-acetylmuramic acid 6-phosphate etherase
MEAIQVMLDNQAQSIISVQDSLSQINLVIEKIFNKLQKNSKSRLVYVGAGTSARIAVQDAVEL